MVEDTKNRIKLPKEQLAILFDKKVRDYLQSKCVTEPDNKTKGWRIWDKDVDATNDLKVWQEAMKRPRELKIKDAALDRFEVYSPSGVLLATFSRREEAVAFSQRSNPWIIISDGKKGYEGPLPKDVDATLELLKKYGG